MTHIVGRVAEWTAVEDFLAVFASGFRCLLLEGEAGIGKTSLWREGVRRAREERLTVLVCRPTKAEARLSFAALGDLVEAVPEQVVAELPEPQRRALEVALLRRASGGDPPDKRGIAVSVLSVLRIMARSSPLLVAVDDAQWLDGPTWAALEFAARRLNDEAVGFLATLRTAEGPARTFLDMVDGQRLRRVSVGAMSAPEIHQLIKQQLSYRFSRPTIMRIVSASRGNPLMAVEIAREVLVAGEPRPGEALPVPPDLQRLMSARIRRLPRETRAELLIATAVAVPTDEVVDVSKLDPADKAGIARATSSGRIEFVHPLFASVIYGLASASAKRELHERLARVVVDSEDRARHLALAAAGPNERVALALEEGAARARSRGAWESAADLLEQARDLTPRDQADAALARTIAAAEHHVHSGDRGRGRKLLDQVLIASPTSSMRAHALRLLAEISASEESYPRAAELLEQALEYAEDPEIRASVLVGLAYVRANMIDYEGALGRAEEALACAESTGQDAVIAEALAFRVMMKYLAGGGVEWNELWRAVELEDPNRLIWQMARPSAVAGCLLLYVGRLDEARERLMRVRGAAMANGDESDLAFFDWWLVWLETLSGNYDTAAGLAAEAGHVAELTGAPSSRAWVLAMRALLAAHRGELTNARRDADDARRLGEQSGWATSTRWAVAARCLADVSSGDYAAAWAAAEPLMAPIETSGIGEPVGFLFLPDALEALIAMGELDRAERLLAPFERRAQELDRAWGRAAGARCRGLLEAARGRLDDAEAELQRALSQHARLAMPFERARTLVALGQVQRRALKRKPARDTLTQAEEIFTVLGAQRWADRAGAELARTHVRQFPDELTPTERRVAELAAAGSTNRQIAAALFVSPKTVEANLARIYRKFGIHSRAELGVRWAGEQARNRP